MENDNGKKAAKKRGNPVGIIILLALVAGGAFLAYIFLNPKLSTDNAMVERTKATVSTKMIGLIARIGAKEQAFVDRGTVLVELDTAELRAQKKQAEANLLVSRGAIGLSEVSMERARSDYRRAESQYQDKIISTEAFEHAQKAFEGAQLDYSLAQKKVEIAQAQIDLIEATLRTATMVAPFDAVVAKKWLNEGDVLQPGSPILTLYDRRSAWVTANFEETKISRFKVGQKATIRVDAYPGVVFNGTVSEIGSNTGNQFSLIPVNNAAGNFTKVTQRIPVKIAIDESTDLGDSSAPRLLAGMSAFVDVED